MTTLSAQAQAKANEYERELKDKARRDAKAAQIAAQKAEYERDLASTPIGVTSGIYRGIRGHDSVDDLLAKCDKWGIGLEVKAGRLIVTQPELTRRPHKAEGIGKLIERQLPLLIERVKGNNPTCDLCRKKATTVRVGPTFVCPAHAAAR